MVLHYYSVYTLHHPFPCVGLVVAVPHAFPNIINTTIKCCTPCPPPPSPRLAWDRSMVPDDLSSSCDPDMAHNTTSVSITTPEKQQPDLSSSNHKELCQQING